MQQIANLRRSVELVKQSLAGPHTFDSLDASALELSTIGSEITGNLEAAFAEALERSNRSAA